MVPPLNSHAAAIDGEISIGVPAPADPASVSDRTLVLHATASGRVLESSGSFGVEGETIVVDPAQALHPGELIQMTLTDGVTASGSSIMPSGYVWQFRTAVDSEPGYLADTGQRMGTSISRSIALGDLDADGDLDAFLANDHTPSAVWLNERRRALPRYRPAHFRPELVALGWATRARRWRTGDLDGDSDLDAFVGNAMEPGNAVWTNDGRGNFTDTDQRLGKLLERGAVALGDLDNDGDLDAFSSVGNSDDCFIHGRCDAFTNKIWMNDGRGVFADSKQAIGNSPTYDIGLADLDGDGDSTHSSATGVDQARSG